MNETPDAASIRLKRAYPINLQERVNMLSTRRRKSSVTHDTLVNTGLSCHDWQKVFRWMFTPDKYIMPDLSELFTQLVAAKKLTEKLSNQPPGKPPADKLYTWSSTSTIHFLFALYVLCLLYVVSCLLYDSMIG